MLESQPCSLHALESFHAGLPALFDRPHLRFVLAAMQAGNSPALVWVDDPERPKAALIWDRAVCLYIGGDASNDAINCAVRDLVTGTIVPQGEKRGWGIFKVDTAQEAWDAQVVSLFAPIPLSRHARVLYALDPAAVPPPTDNLPDGLHLRLIDAALLSELTRPGVNYMVAEIELCWTAIERFLTEGFGYCIVSDADGVVCWCTAEYVSEGMCGIGIETRESYRGQGIATAAACAFARHAIRQGRRVHWDSWLANTPSVRVAEKAGFRKIGEYAVWLAKLN